MTPFKSLVLDANILIRAVLGKKINSLILQYNNQVAFYTPDLCFQDAEKYLPIILEKRHNIDVDLAMDVLTQISQIVYPLDKDLYSQFEVEARKRIASKDEDDWPVIAAALFFNCPIWTEDKDFFGTGIATWETYTLEIYLSEQ
ncbi:MAG: nucleotide-binding protein [Cyanobacteria bacterium]|nr:nucleotide-binding protein [Cyanobacteria bacterium GSL.Bin1]